MRRTTRVLGAIVGLMWSVAASPVGAIPPCDTLLPPTTRGFVSLANVDEIAESWDKTQLGQLLKDPAMEAFTEDLNRQLKDRLQSGRRQLGISWEDLQGVPNGETSLAVVETGHQTASLVLLVDVTDRHDRATDLLKKVDADLKAEGAKRTEKKNGDTTLIVYELPPDEEAEANAGPRYAVYFLRGDLLAGAEDVVVLEDVLQRVRKPSEEHLGTVAAYQAVLKRCHEARPDLEPQAKWFVDPLKLISAIRNSRPNKTAGVDYLKAMSNTGFEAIQGVGGMLNLASSPRHDLLHRTSIYAPRPWEGSMNMLAFPNGDDLVAQPWVPADVALYVTFHINALEAYDNFGPIFDETVGEGEQGVWEDVVLSLEEDPNGPGINIRRDLVQHLKSRATLITDYLLPITPTSERMLFAIETLNESTLAETIRKSMEPDPAVTKREFEGHVIWEVREEEVALPEVEFAGQGIPGLDPVGTAPAARSERALPSSAVAVANGHLFISSHVDFLEKILHQDPDRRPLAEDVDYQLVVAELDAVSPGENSFRAFTRTEDMYRPTYELLKNGQMAESKTMLGNLLNRVLGGGPDSPLREQEIDGSKMPDFEVARRYLGPAGLYAVSEDDGWFVMGFTLNKSAE